MQYKVPQHIDNNKVFLVNFSDVQFGRLDAEFYKPNIAYLEKQVSKSANKRLKDFCITINGGATPKADEQEKYYSDEINGIPFLRVQNLQATGEITFDNCKYINKETHNGLLSRSQVKEGFLLVKITGVGRMAVSSVAPDNFIGNINQHIVAINTGSKTTSKYLANYLNLDIIEKIASRHSTGGTRPALDYPSLQNLPIIENIDFYPIEYALIQKRKKEQEAAAKLNRIDDYLLRELGITMPNTQIQTLEDRTFIAYFSDVIGKRLDPNGVYLFMQQPKSSKYESIQLCQIAIIEKGEAITKDQVNTLGKYPVIAGGQTSPYNNDTFNYDGDVITVSASGSAGYVWYHEYPIFASDCTVIYAKDKCFLTKYIFEVLKAEQNFIYRLKQGAIQPHVYPNDLANLLIPNIKLSKQREIVEHISQLRAEAKRLQEEGAEILRKAKEDIEKMIIE